MRGWLGPVPSVLWRDIVVRLRDIRLRDILEMRQVAEAVMALITNAGRRPIPPRPLRPQGSRLRIWRRGSAKCMAKRKPNMGRDAPLTISRNCGAKEWFVNSGPHAAMSRRPRRWGLPHRIDNSFFIFVNKQLANQRRD